MRAPWFWGANPRKRAHGDRMASFSEGAAVAVRPKSQDGLADARLAESMAESARLVDQTLDQVLPKPAGLQSRVQGAMPFATFAGGKRLRPFLVVNCARLFQVDDARSLRVAAALEVLHTYSLVHDDLPCMDDDDLRRGRPTTHRAFDEMTAVLAGDALLTIAFEILADAETHPNAEVRCQLISRLDR